MTGKKPAGLLYAPSRGGLPGIEDRHYRRLAAEMPNIEWLLCRDGEEFLAALPECDHLVAALPGEDTSATVVDAGRLALLPRGAYVYNIGRGNAIAMDALVDALRSGALGGAGLDVYDKEPLPGDHPIRTCPNVILMPHVSAFASNYMDLYLDELLPRMREAFADGGRPKAGDQ